MHKISPKTYLHSFCFVVIILALARCGYDFKVGNAPAENVDSLAVDSLPPLPVDEEDMESPVTTSDSKAAGSKTNAHYTGTTDSVSREYLLAITKPHRILSVPSFKTEFPDSNSVQLEAAKANGVDIVQNRADAEHRKAELVYVGANPYFYVDRLRESIPYLVPKASVLLQDIGRAFYDSLYVKGVPMHQIIVTSVLRTQEDVERLRRHNGNASENSCHRFGTTFDICYNRYITVQTEQQPRRAVTNDTLKWVLAEVLRDKRNAGRCYIKYEVRQGCWHITVR